MPHFAQFGQVRLPGFFAASLAAALKLHTLPDALFHHFEQIFCFTLFSRYIPSWVLTSVRGFRPRLFQAYCLHPWPFPPSPQFSTHLSN
ncbi:hypothetical protein BDR07DRAFT_1491639 [Suillus spraguei]|nr:hypothetical protein BDR07DRAFT_1491639 [Suillus spraguei]